MLRPRLNTDHLAALVALEQAGGVSQAARLLHLTQPAFTYRVQELERRSGVTLFDREGRRLRWTAAGERLLASARNILQELLAAESDCRKLGAGVREIVRVGSRASSNFRWLPRLLEQFGRSHPDVDVELLPHLGGPPLQALLEGRVDVDIVAGKVARSDVVSQLLFVDELVALVSSASPLADKPFVTARDLAAQTYVTYSSTPEPGLEYERLFRPAGVSPQRFVQVGLTEAVIEMVRANYGVSVLSRWALGAALDQPDLKLIRITRSGLSLRWYAAVRKAYPKAGVARELVTALVGSWEAAGMR
jgi:LysR family transcriptional regulator, regulator for metE and metH